MSDKPENPPAFPVDGPTTHPTQAGMSLRDWFAGQALANSGLCTGHAPDWLLRAWFGDRCGIHQSEIAAKQAHVIADAMLATRGKL